MPRYTPECSPDEFLNNDLKQQLKQTPLPATQPELQDIIRNILDHIADIPERIKGYFTQADIPCVAS